MRKKRNLHVLISFFIISMILSVIMSACSNAGRDNSSSIETISDLNNKEITIGALEGSNPSIRMPQIFPDANYKYFRSDTDGLLAVQQGQIDGFLSGTPMLEYALARQNTSLKLIMAYHQLQGKPKKDLK